MKKIDIHEYLRKYRHSHPEFKDFDKGNIISKEKSKYSDIIEVCTTNVYPQLLKFDNEEIFVWDHTYWMLYRRFLLGIFRFHPNTSSIDDLSDFLRSFQYLFLSLRFSMLPAYAYYFASKYYKLNKLICHFRMYSDKEEEKFFKEVHGAQFFEQLMDFAQSQVYLHELRHYGYRNNKDFFLRESGIVKSIFKMYDSTLKKLPQDNPINGEDRLWDTYYHFANIEKLDMIEEICCDIFPIVEFVRNFGQKEKENSKEEIFAAYVSTIRYVFEMQNIFIQVERKWKSVKYILDDMLSGKKPDFEKFSSDENDTKRIVHSRIGIESVFAAHILGINPSSNIENELFDSDFYREALQKSASDSFDHMAISTAAVYAKQISENFSLSQLRSARDLLIGWY